MNRIVFKDESLLQILGCDNECILMSDDDVIKIYPTDDNPVKICYESSVKTVTQSTDDYSEAIAAFTDIGDSTMRVLFVKPEKYKDVSDWYSRMHYVQKNRKTTLICAGSNTFQAQISQYKLDAKHTTFYFDEDMSITEILQCFKEFVRTYGADDSTFISKNRMRRIDINKLMEINCFDCYSDITIDDAYLPKLISDAMGESSKRVCKILL